MIDGKTILAVIPARGGSKGLPDKNILPLAGKPLITWTIEAARGSKYIDRCIVSTDDEAIASISKKYGCEVPFMRSAELSTDDANSNDVYLHALDMLENEYDIVIALQPTSPLRKSEDIEHALELFQKVNAQAMVSVCKSIKPLNWYHNVEKSGKLKPINPHEKIATNRQEVLPTYTPNGALYIALTDYFRDKKSFYTDSTIAYIMPTERSVDIDYQLDLDIAEIILNK